MSFAGMSNVLDDDETAANPRARPPRLDAVGASQQATGVRRETISGYLKAAGIAGARPRAARANAKPKPAIYGGGVHRLRAAKPAIPRAEVSTDSRADARAARRVRAPASRIAS